MATRGRGADVGVECSGHPDGAQTLVDASAPADRVVLVGMGPQPTKIDTVAAMVKEVDLTTVFRYANAYPDGDRVDTQRTSTGSSTRDGPIPI